MVKQILVRFCDTICAMKIGQVILVFIISFVVMPIAISFAASDPAKPFFGESITKEELQKRYDRGDKIKILIAPGHDKKSGTEFNGIREADLNLDVAEKLRLLFSLDPHFEVFVTRDKSGFNKALSEYLTSQRSTIIEFKNRHREAMKTAIEQGFIETVISLLGTNVNRKELIKLYGVNKWANENNIDIIINIHFNDDPIRRRNRRGKFSGFSINVPEKQLPNSKISKLIAESVYSKIGKIVSPSNMHLEKDGIIENQRLIALGANASLNAASLFIEYGYIYEPWISDPVISPLLNGELALQTYLGIKNFFDRNAKVFKYSSFLLPYEWTNWLGEDQKNNKDVFILQLALTQEGLYPPFSKNLALCPLSGNFGECTKKSLLAFQKKYNLNATGFVDTPTLTKLNEMYAK